MINHWTIDFYFVHLTVFVLYFTIKKNYHNEGISGRPGYLEIATYFTVKLPYN